MRSTALAVLASAAVVSVAATASGDEYRRPGLEGKWSRRHITAPMNSLRIVAGPGQPMLLGGRFGDQIVDGGGQFIRENPSGDGLSAEQNQWWVRGGVAFGLTEDWEAGALFLPFRLSPDFGVGNITVFITHGFRFHTWDLGLRLTFQTPTKDTGGNRVWNLNPGIPVLLRAGAFRIDSALMVPFATRAWWWGLTVPVRASVSLNPHVFLALESGFVEPRFDRDSDTTVPLGALLGYTALFGGRVADFTAQFSWDSFWLPAAAEGTSALQPGSYRVGLGVVIHSLVR